MDEDLGTEAPLAEGGDGGTPDLPLPEPRSQPDAADAADVADDADPATAAATASALEDAARKTASAASLADVLGKRSVGAVSGGPASAGPKAKALKSQKRARHAERGPGIASFFGGGERTEDKALSSGGESDDAG
jgi:hypothetical protein